MSLWSKITDFFKKVKEEIIILNQDDETTAPRRDVWEFVEEELEGDPDFDDLLIDPNEFASEPIDEEGAVAETTTFIKLEDVVGNKKILMMDKNMNIVNVYDNIREIMNANPGYTYSGTYGCLRGRRNTYKGYYFKYKDEYQKEINSL